MSGIHPDAVYNHSSESMPEIADGSIALTVTSPPYWNAIDYDIHAKDSTQHYRTRNYKNGYIEYEEYLQWIERIFCEVHRVTKPGGFCTIVIGTVLMDGKHYPVPFDLTNRLVTSGWEFHQDIVWHKCTAGVKRAGVAIQKPYPGYYYPNIMTEYILVFRKAGPRIYSNRSKEEKQRARYEIDKVFTMDIANNIWHIAPVPPNIIDHPCPFPEEIPYRLIQLYSYPGETVLDPFAGSGQTLKVAAHSGRHYIGYDLLDQYVEMCGRRISEPLSLREEQLTAVFKKVPMHTPTSETHRVPSARANPTSEQLAIELGQHRMDKLL